jgi:hypothetical protein
MRHGSDSWRTRTRTMATKDPCVGHAERDNVAWPVRVRNGHGTEETRRGLGDGSTGEAIGSRASACVVSILGSWCLKDNHRGSDGFIDTDYDDYDGGCHNSDGRRVNQEWSPEWYHGPDDE